MCSFAVLPLCCEPFVFPQEYEIDKTLGIKGPDDVAKMGIAEYNKQCRNIVMRYATEWEVSDQSSHLTLLLLECQLSFLTYSNCLDIY